MRTRLGVALWLIAIGTGLAHAQQTAVPQARGIDPLRFEDEVRAFESADRTAMPPEGAVVVTGSSSVRLWHPTIQEDLAPLTVIPRGFGGSTMEDALYYIDRLAIVYKPRAVAIYEGDNDTGRYEVPPETIVSQFEQIVARIHAALPGTRIYAFAVKPSVLRWEVWPQARRTNELLEALCDANELLTYVDVATPFLDAAGHVMTDVFVADNLHLNEKGYRIWTAAVREVLVRHELPYERRTN